MAKQYNALIFLSSFSINSVKIFKASKNFFSYLPFAHDSTYHKKGKNSVTNFDLSFVGTADEERYKLLNNLAEYSIILAGDGWNRYDLSKNIKYVSNVNSKRYASLISKSKFSLNILRKQNKDSHNMKTFEIPSMGGLLLTEKNRDQKSFFLDNDSCVMYKNVNDIKLKINSYNKNLKKYSKIKNKGYKIVKKNSYKDRVKYLIKTIYD